MKTKDMGFCAGMLAQVKSLSTKYQKTKVFGLSSTLGHTGSGFCNNEAKSLRTDPSLA
ncbi:hypothetical protein [Nostoc sp.]|uniref:hypothetical protein n=1 Tax=Nostoc sp. TaxID=1180 RepID=UPI002FF554F1